MRSIVLVAALIVGCGGGSSTSYETLLDDGFDNYPADYTWAGGGGPKADPSYGYPAPSAFVREQSVSPGTRFTFSNQGIDARVTAFLESNMQYGEQYASLRIVPDFQDIAFPNDGIAAIVYHLVNNRDANLPVTGFPAGQTAEIQCAFNTAALTTAQVPYTEGAVAYDLFFIVDAQGSHCGYDDTDVATDAPTSLTGTYRATLGSSFTTNAWFDNLLVQREL